jgi:predicted DNA repair protein MutK
LPAALLLSLLLPQAITPLLMLGGAYLCYEGVEKIYAVVLPHGAHAHEAEIEPIEIDPESLEDQKVASAIKTDFILSAEIMAIALAALPDSGLVAQGVILALVGIGITALVYGGVAVIVKADDVGLWMAQREGRNVLTGAVRGVGRGIVQGMPYFLNALGFVGTAAMIWVGGGIIVHGLEAFGIAWLGHAIHHAATMAAGLVPAAAGFAEWLVEVLAAAVAGLMVGFVAIPTMSYIVSPAWRVSKKVLRRR